ncbi:hypothetical protein [Chitinophaga sp. YIM B06452]|uniref:hypothetical protein n=1 Tax=Chitinophaga sp. YIM B06452 TaxID=3082158 RepID=UPI0031FECE6D
MGCCGKNRSAWTAQHNYNSQAYADNNNSPIPSAVTFQYNGAASLTVAGAVTGRRYRFEGYSAQVEVDIRDAAAMRGVPHLVRVF